MANYYCGRRGPDGIPYVLVGTPEQLSYLTSEERRPLLRVYCASVDPLETPLEVAPPPALGTAHAGTARPLPLRLDLRQHSSVFEWGRESRGCLQLSVPILSDCAGAVTVDVAR